MTIVHSGKSPFMASGLCVVLPGELRMPGLIYDILMMFGYTRTILIITNVQKIILHSLGGCQETRYKCQICPMQYNKTITMATNHSMLD